MEILFAIFQVLFWLAVIFCFFFTFTFLNLVLKNLREQKTIEQVKEELKESMMVYVEKNNGQYYMFDVISNFFVAQGTTEDELWEQAQKRCPDINLILASKEGGNITVSTSKVKEQK